MKSTQHYLAAGSALGLAALLITGCGVEAAQAPPLITSTSTVAFIAESTSTPLSPTAAPAAAISTPAPPDPTQTPTSVSTTLATLPSVVETAVQITTTAATISNSMVSETTLTLPTYPIWDFLTEQIDPAYNIPALYFNRSAYEAAAPAPAPKEYIAVMLENAYLRLTFLPQLGGRLYSAVVKATGQEIFYHNPVVKPSRYGVLSPAEANWWLATGGMEWAYPTQEHGYRFGVPWQYTINETTEGATITLSDVTAGRVGAEVQITLPADSAAFTVIPKLINQSSAVAPVQFWLNAALALAPGSMSNQTQFVVPVDQIVVHSRGEPGWTVPDARQVSSWPLVGEADLRDYRQWANYLGFFVPDMTAPFIGAYNPETNLGVVRLVEPGAVPGTKLFAFGAAFPDKSYTDDGSQYFEMWGGANRGFWPEDDITVAPNDVLTWQESWWPLAGLGGLTWANQQAAIHLNQADGENHLSLLVPRPAQGKVMVWAGETPILNESFIADPAVPLQWGFSSPTQPIRVQLLAEDGTVLLDYQP